MELTHIDERTFKLILSDEELDDVKHEAEYTDMSTLDVMKTTIFMVFVQVMSCRWLRRTLSLGSDKKYSDCKIHSCKCTCHRG